MLHHNGLALQEHATKQEFSTATTDESGHLAVASDKGEVRLFDAIRKNAKTASSHLTTIRCSSPAPHGLLEGLDSHFPQSSLLGLIVTPTPFGSSGRRDQTLHLSHSGAGEEEQQQAAFANGTTVIVRVVSGYTTNTGPRAIDLLADGLIALLLRNAEGGSKRHVLTRARGNIISRRNDSNTAQVFPADSHARRAAGSSTGGKEDKVSEQEMASAAGEEEKFHVGASKIVDGGDGEDLARRAGLVQRVAFGPCAGVVWAEYRDGSPGELIGLLGMQDSCRADTNICMPGSRRRQEVHTASCSEGGVRVQAVSIRTYVQDSNWDAAELTSCVVAVHFNSSLSLDSLARPAWRHDAIVRTREKNRRGSTAPGRRCSFWLKSGSGSRAVGFEDHLHQRSVSLSLCRDVATGKT
ncbi:hypothetical protein CF326_g7878 [Tilletia indica]|nr:hypothetical protein CF326_g7878 [Tilletia indica]